MGERAREWPDALTDGVRLRREPDGTVLEGGADGRQWRAVFDDGPLSNCWCRFGSSERDADRDETARAAAGPGWERVYVCRSCRANPELPWVGGKRPT